MNLDVSEHAGRLLGSVQDPANQGIFGRNLVATEPEKYIRFATHRPDFNHLLETEKVCGNAAVNIVRQALVPFLNSFNDCSSMHTRSRAKRIVADDGIIWRNGGFRGGGNLFAIGLEIRQVAVDQAHKPQIYKHQFHRGVAHALAERIGSAVHLMRSRGDGRERVGDGQAAIVVAVPIHTNLFATRLYNFVDYEFHQIERAVRRGVTHGVAQNNGASPVLNRCGIQAFHRLRVRANRVFGNVHGGEAMLDGKLHRFFRGALKMINRPVLYQSANGTGAKKRGGFNRDSDSLRNLDDWANIVFVRSRRTVWLDSHPVRCNLSRQRFGMCRCARTGTGQPDIDVIDS